MILYYVKPSKKPNYFHNSILYLDFFVDEDILKSIAVNVCSDLISLRIR